MPKSVVPLTATQVKSAKPKSKVYKLTDGGGLSLRVTPSGQKTWELRVMINGKRQSFYKPLEGMTLAQARAWRDETRAVAMSDDPVSLLKEIKFSAVFEEWYERWQKRVTDDYGKQVKSSVMANVIPYLGDMDVRNIRPIHIIESLKGMEARGVLEYLKRTKSGIKMALDYAVARGYIDVNPALAVTPQAFEAHKSTPMRAISPDELPQMIKTVEDAKVSGELTILTYCLIYWQMVTFARPGEACRARWDEVDTDKKIWEIPADKMKKRRAHVVPLPDMLIKMLDFLQSANQRGVYLFEGKSEDGHLSRETVRCAFGRLAIDSTAHGLRSLARSYLAGKYDRDMLERCLAHVVGSKTERVYDRYAYLDERREIIDAWADIIENERAKSVSIF